MKKHTKKSFLIEEWAGIQTGELEPQEFQKIE